MEQASAVKVYVPVKVQFDEAGCMRPLVIFWEDGEQYAIDKISDIRSAPALRAGGMGDRYTVWIGGKQSYLFFERSPAVTGCALGRWFVERRREASSPAAGPA